MTQEYYYTRSLATAAVAIEQGFEDGERNVHENEWENQYVNGLWYPCKAWRFPKTPHNEALMKPVTGDIVKTQDPKDKSRYQLGYWEHVSCYSLLSVPTIIHRNNKPFPVWDKEEV